MKVADLMRTDLKTIRASANVADAIAALLQTRVSAVPVVDQKERPIAVVSNQDVLRATVVSDLQPWAPDLTPVVASRDLAFQKALQLRIDVPPGH